MAEQDSQLTSVASQISAVLKEVSDIKSSLAVNTNETQNIKSSIIEIKVDIKDIKMEAVTRREYNDGMNGLKRECDEKLIIRDERIAAIEKKYNKAMTLMWGSLGAIGLILLNAIFKLIIKQ